MGKSFECVKMTQKLRLVHHADAARAQARSYKVTTTWVLVACKTRTPILSCSLEDTLYSQPTDHMSQHKGVSLLKSYVSRAAGEL
jgi:hypothetical protein